MDRRGMENDGKMYFVGKDTEERRKVGRGSSSQLGKSSKPFNDIPSFKIFSESHIMDATDDLSPSSVIRLGGFGSVYRGTFDNVDVAIKMLDAKSHQGLQEFFQAIMALGHRRHKNVVNLIGACFEQCSLIYEYLPQGDVESCLENSPAVLTWQIRTRIVYQLCLALKFLHSSKPKPLVHGDVKPRNILLDVDFHAKLSVDGHSHFLTEVSDSGAFLEVPICGTMGYIDPEFLKNGILTPGCDLYSFGITILRLLTAEPAVGIVQKVRNAYKNKSLMTCVDSIAGNWPEEVAYLLAYFGVLSCGRKRNSPELMAEISGDLKEILIANDIEIERKQHEEEEDDDAAGNNQSNIQSPQHSEGQGSLSMLNIRTFTKDDIEDATEGLSASTKIGEGGFGSVHKGVLDNMVVAIKKLNPKSSQGITEFLQEMDVLSRIKHENLVKLIGVCLRPSCLIYEYLPNGSVEDCLRNCPRLLTWQKRARIVYQTCSAVMFLHATEPHCIVHGDLKPANILLDGDFNTKLSDFGLCRSLPKGSATEAFIQTKSIQGSDWYIDPDFLGTGRLTSGCDVYSFGVTILRILTGAIPNRIIRKVEKAMVKNTLMTIVDSTAGQWPEDVAGHLADFGLNCTELDRNNSKLMTDISTYLKGILDDTVV